MINYPWYTTVGPTNRTKYYALVNEILKEQANEIDESGGMDLKFAQKINLDGEAHQGPNVIDATKKLLMAKIFDLNSDLFNTNTMVFRFTSGYFDLTEYYDWLTAKSKY